MVETCLMIPFLFQNCLWAGRKEGGREGGKGGERQGTNGRRKKGREIFYLILKRVNKSRRL